MPSYTKVLRQGTTDAAVVGIDFSEGRQVASFPELAPSLPADLTVLECEPATVEELADEQLRPAEYARRVVHDVVTASGHRVLAVLARCGGAGLACRVAEEIAANTDSPPAVILFDPEVVDARHLYTQFERAVHSVQDGLPIELVTETLSRCDNLARQHSGDLTRLLVELRRTYASLVPPALEHWDIPVQFGAELVERFTVFTRYLLCASRAPVRLPNLPIHEVLSQQHPPVSADQDHLITRLDVYRTELLSAPETARITTELVRNGRVTAPPR